MTSVERHISPLLQVCSLGCVHVCILRGVVKCLFVCLLQFEAKVVQNSEQTVNSLSGHVNDGTLKATVKTIAGQGHVCYNIRLNV